MVNFTLCLLYHNFFKKENLVSPTAKHSVRHWGKETKRSGQNYVSGIKFWLGKKSNIGGDKLNEAIKQILGRFPWGAREGLGSFFRECG